MKKIEFQEKEGWRDWLAKNHDHETEIWLVYYKKATGIPSITYDESLDEALCYGWIDCGVRKIDDQRFARKFTPRKEKSSWSLVNKKKVEKLTLEGRMTAYGMEKVEAAKKSGAWDKPGQQPKLDFTMPPEFKNALKENPQAEAFYQGLTQTYQKQYLAWIITAKRADTKTRRIQEAVRLLKEGKKLGLR